MIGPNKPTEPQIKPEQDTSTAMDVDSQQSSGAEAFNSKTVTKQEDVKPLAKRRNIGLKLNLSEGKNRKITLSESKKADGTNSDQNSKVAASSGRPVSEKAKDTQNMQDMSSRLFKLAENTEVGPQVFSKPATHNEFSIYPIKNHDTVLWAHAMPRVERFDPSQPDLDQRVSMWLLAEQNNINTIVALEQQGWNDYKQYQAETDDGVIEAVIDEGSKQPLTSIQSVGKELADKLSLSEKEENNYLLKGIEKRANQYTVTVTHKDSNEQEVSKKQYTVIEHQYWQDDKGLVPELVDKILELTPDKDCMVHCLAGVGRTGTLIILKQMEKAFQAKTLTGDNLVSFICQAVKDGRVMRGKNLFVKTKEQMQTLLEYGMKITGASKEAVDAQLQQQKHAK
ncbi:MAG: protein-tyrosine phosphatase family protein [Endozoicomonadaceae bacterium]|nr:protein-tyrosine phosphatase family protein [Endozoicomonadaceae bacterium]